MALFSKSLNVKNADLWDFHQASASVFNWISYPSSVWKRVLLCPKASELPTEATFLRQRQNVDTLFRKKQSLNALQQAQRKKCIQHSRQSDRNVDYKWTFIQYYKVSIKDSVITKKIQNLYAMKNIVAANVGNRQWGSSLGFRTELVS